MGSISLSVTVGDLIFDGFHKWNPIGRVQKKNPLFSMVHVHPSPVTRKIFGMIWRFEIIDSLLLLCGFFFFILKMADNPVK